MTVLDGLAPVHAGASPFEYHPGDLKACGVNLAPQQIELFNSAAGKTYFADTDVVWAMTVEVFPDPDQGMDGSKPMTVWSLDEDGDPNYPRQLLLPRLVRLDWNLWPDLDVLDPDWRRFPSLPGRAIDEDWYAGAPQAFRLWNLWPLDYLGQQAVGDSYQGAHYGDWALSYGEYLELYQGAVSGCEKAHPDEHLHHDDPQWRWGCFEGEEWEREMRLKHVFVDEDGLEHWAAPPDGWGEPEWPVNEWWQVLLGYAERNAWASLSACPNQDEVLEDEKRYSPCLWSF